MSADQFKQRVERLLYRNIEDTGDYPAVRRMLMWSFRSGAEKKFCREQFSSIVMRTAPNSIEEPEDRRNIRRLMTQAFDSGRLAANRCRIAKAAA